jgi:peptide/nickel transport system permease protein
MIGGYRRNEIILFVGIISFSHNANGEPIMEFYRRFRKHRLGVVGVILVAFFILVAIGAPLIAPSNPHKLNLDETFAPLSLKHPLGTDNLGRDMLSRVIYGTRIALLVGIGAVGISALFGGLAGLIAGFLGSKIDTTIMRSLDVVWAFPPILLALALVAIRGPSLSSVIWSIAIVGIPGHARIVRASVLSVKEKTFVLAAMGSGIGIWRIIFHHILPNVLAPVIIISSLSIATTIMIEATLSYLGLGMQPPNDSWGMMISEGQKHIRTYPYYSIFPGVMIMIIVFAFNVFGDALRDAWDPKLKT